MADAMYYAAQNLTTDASRLHKAMDEYHKFIIHECKEEPISEDLEEAAEDFCEGEWDGLHDNGGNPLYTQDYLEYTFKAGAKWQRERDAKYKADNNICCMNFDDIEAARIGAYEQGKSDMKQQMMKDAISAKVTEIYYPTDSCLEIEATLPEGRFEDGDKVLIIKEN